MDTAWPVPLSVALRTTAAGKDLRDIIRFFAGNTSLCLKRPSLTHFVFNEVLAKSINLVSVVLADTAQPYLLTRSLQNTGLRQKKAFPQVGAAITAGTIWEGNTRYLPMISHPAALLST
jgi:hypothetical protein